MRQIASWNRYTHRPNWYEPPVHQAFRKDLKAAEEAGATYTQLNALWRYANQENWQRFYSLLNQIAGGQK